MKTKILIEELMQNHKEWLENLTPEQYEKEGEEEFKEWLETEVRKVEK